MTKINIFLYFFSAQTIFINPFFDYFKSVIIFSIEIFYFTGCKTCSWHTHHLRSRSLERPANKWSVEISHCFFQTWRLLHCNSKLTLKIASGFLINIKEIVWFILKLKWHLWKVCKFFKIFTCKIHDTLLFSFINTLTKNGSGVSLKLFIKSYRNKVSFTYQSTNAWNLEIYVWSLNKYLCTCWSF